MKQYYTSITIKNDKNANLFDNIQKRSDYLIKIGGNQWNVSTFTAQIY